MRASSNVDAFSAANRSTSRTKSGTGFRRKTPCQGEARARRVPALEAGGRWAEHRTLTSSAPWRNGNAAVCKTATSGVGTRRRIHHASVARTERRPSSKRVNAGSTPAGSTTWRANPPGRGRRLLSARCGNACESCSQLSANLVFRGLGSLADRAPSKRCQGGSIPPVRTRLRSSSG